MRGAGNPIKKNEGVAISVVVKNSGGICETDLKGAQLQPTRVRISGQDLLYKNQVDRSPMEGECVMWREQTTKYI